MTKRVWIIWVTIEIAAVLMLAALWPANVSAAIAYANVQEQVADKVALVTLRTVVVTSTATRAQAQERMKGVSELRRHISSSEGSANHI